MSELLDYGTIEADQQSLLRSVHTALKDAFGYRFDLWLPLQEGDFAVVGWMHAHGQRSDPGSESLVAQVAADPTTPLVFDGDEHQSLLVVPFIRKKTSRRRGHGTVYRRLTRSARATGTDGDSRV